MTLRDKFFLGSKAWAAEAKSLDLNYFVDLDQMHPANVLWIGSADCLIPVRDLTNTDPGEIMIYRNIGTQIRQDDLSLMAIIEEAVVHLDVDHIVICGFSQCSAILDVINGAEKGYHVSSWLSDLRKL